MERKVILVTLRFCIVCIGILSIALMVFVIPDAITWYIVRLCHKGYWEWIVLLTAALLPCFAVLLLGWQITGRIQRGQIFICSNVTRFQWIFRLLLWDSGLYLLALLIFFRCGFCPPSVLLISVVFPVVGIVLAFCARAFAAIFQWGTELQEYNDLTI